MSHAVRDSALVPPVTVFAPTAASPAVQAGGGASDGATLRAERIRSIVAEHYASLWRFVRRLGVPEADAEDAAQKCLWVVSQRIDDIAQGKEKPFLFGVAARVAKAWRRGNRQRPDGGDERLAELPAPGRDAAEQLDDRRALALLDALLASLPADLRTVFVLYELEELTMAEIARALELPAGTVASRLRRAREAFEALSRRVRRDARAKEGR
jgi:RNA polymerase sigma-70 factor (ECF subfamily)